MSTRRQILFTYIKHVYNGEVAYTFLEDDLFGGDMTIADKERGDTDVKRVQNLSVTTKATVGQACRGGNSSSIRGGGRRGGNNFIVDRQHYSAADFWTLQWK
jgi:hypothetical protein